MNLYSYDFLMFKKQIIWYFISFVMLIFMMKFRLNKIIKYVFLLYIVFNVLLLYLLLFGDVINGSKAWINIGFISFQPSEFMKIILLLFLSYVSTYYDKYIFKCIILTLIPSILTFLEPDTGNVIFYLVILFSILIYKNDLKKFMYVILIILMFLGTLFISYYYFKDIFINIFGSSFFYRIDRVINLFNNETYQLNMGLTGIVSRLVIGGDITNVVIPEAGTDFMFSYLIMNSGFIVLIIYLIINLVFNLILIDSIKNTVGISKLVIFIFLIMKIFQEGIHIMMNIGLFPITGIPLPFISYGGSSILCYFIIVGIIISSYMDMEDMDKVEVYNKLV